ncbi:HD domain-containing phosphohydrolase [Desulfobacula sp.]|uniref:HD domain-containing phosphohydrolase n=1 Tax=Desulfobacula sp. TaxID=2593537 RepID=UPI002607287A|nr:HD domain-containing phosphohydrolase [Desulfobacula sp.]
MADNKKFSKNPRINIVIENFIDELSLHLQEQAREISELTAIGKAIGTGKNINNLLEMILTIARRFTKADGGTLYLVDQTSQNLDFNVIHNESLNIKKGGSAIDLPSVPLYDDNHAPNLSNVSSYVFHTGEIVNIKNVYTTKKFDFEGTKKFDAALHYKSQSMIVIPMRNHEDEIIGILQLINAKDLPSNSIIPFSSEDQEKAVALASQASVILTQQTLILEMKALFEAFINAIAVLIDEKSKHTGGHIQRVTELSMMIAQKINQDPTVFKKFCLSPDQMDELRIAALMHDTGKISTPDHIIDKSSRLETVHDKIELIETRWELFKTQQKLMAAQTKLALFDQTEKQMELARIDTIYNEKIQVLETEFETLSFINASKKRLEEEHFDALAAINKKSCHVSGKDVPYLTENEFENLCILEGTLTAAERDIINNHADLTEKMLNQLPWPKKLAHIPSIAGAHHEKLDGSGYPLHLTKENLTIQARILAIADIFEALSAPDRPYKSPMTLSQAEAILQRMGEQGMLDKDIITLFFRSGTHLEYAQKHLSDFQMDL